MEGMHRLQLGAAGDKAFDNAISLWEQTKDADDARSLVSAMLPLCDKATNLYFTDMAADTASGYRLTNVNEAFDLRFSRTWAIGDYPDPRYVEAVILPAYATVEAEREPVLHRVQGRVQHMYAIYERLMLPYLATRRDNRACLSLSRLLLLVDNATEPPTAPLSLREQQCLRLLAEGMSAKKIAAELELATRTVEHTVERIKGKLGARNVAHAVAKAAVLAAESGKSDAVGPSGPPLSPRERMCLSLLASGRSGAQMAAALGVSEKAIEKHVGALKLKFGARNAAELAAKGVRAIAAR